MALRYLPADICVGNKPINEHTRTGVCTRTRKLSPAQRLPPPPTHHTVWMAEIRPGKFGHFQQDCTKMPGPIRYSRQTAMVGTSTSLHGKVSRPRHCDLGAGGAIPCAARS